jgi:hypothetical protein
LAFSPGSFVVASIDLIYACFFTLVHYVWLVNVNSADVTLTNVAFQYTSVSFVEVIKAGVPVLLFVFAALAGGSSTLLLFSESLS